MGNRVVRVVSKQKGGRGSALERSRTQISTGLHGHSDFSNMGWEREVIEWT